MLLTSIWHKNYIHFSKKAKYWKIQQSTVGPPTELAKTTKYSKNGKSPAQNNTKQQNTTNTKTAKDSNTTAEYCMHAEAKQKLQKQSRT